MSLSKDEQNDILRAIALQGAAVPQNAQVVPIINGNMQHVLNLSSGSSRLHSSVAKRFKLILSQPATLSELNPFEIRCALCKSVISYPSWYYSVRYAVNHFHYFVCFDAQSPDKPSTRCYRKG